MQCLRKSTFHNSLAAVLFLLIACHAGILRAAHEAADLVKLVGADAALCIELVGLHDELPRLRDSALFARIEKLPAYRQWTASGDYEKLMKARAAVEKVAGKPFETLLSDLFGRAVVLAVYVQERERPVGVLLTRTASPDVLQAALAAWNNAERQTASPKQFAGQTYFARTHAGRDGRAVESAYFVTFGETLALSDNEAAIQRVIVLRGTGTAGRQAAPAGQPAEPATASLGNHAGYRAARESLSPHTVVSAYFNPRSWDAALKIEQGLTATDPVARVVAVAWRHSRSVIAGLQFRDGIAVEAIAHFDAAPPLEFEEVIKKTEGPVGFLEKVPREALVAFAGRFDFASLVGLFACPLNESQVRKWNAFRQVTKGLFLGLSVWEVIPQMGPNWGLYAVPNRDLRPTALPVEAVLAFELPPIVAENEPRKTPTLRQALENALLTGLNLWAAQHNSQGPPTAAVVRTEERAGAVVRWIEGMPFHQPAFACAGNFLVLSSSPQALAEFVGQTAEQSLPKLPEYERWSQTFFPDENQVLFVNVARMRRLLADRRPLVAGQIAAAHALSGEQAQQRLERLDDVLQLLDGGFAAARIRSDRVRLVIGGVVSESGKP